MMFQTIQTIHFLRGYDPGNIDELSPVYCCLVASLKSLKVPVIILLRASDANEEYVGQLTTPVGWGKNADDAGGITPDLNVKQPFNLSFNLCC